MEKRLVANRQPDLGGGKEQAVWVVVKIDPGKAELCFDVLNKYQTTRGQLLSQPIGTAASRTRPGAASTGETWLRRVRGQSWGVAIGGG